MPALDLFPIAAWERISSSVVRRMPAQLLSYGDPRGHEPLRRAIVRQLAIGRGIRCECEQVIVTGGAQQAIALAVSVLLDPGAKAWMEDPGYLGIRGALLAAGATIVPVPVDQFGLNVSWGRAAAPDARLAIVTPGCQMPLGMPLHPVRRAELLEWAREVRGFVIEDDYANEVAVTGRPEQALFAADPRHVVHVGTFSKVLFPALRLGYLVVPAALVDVFTRARSFGDVQLPVFHQMVLARFIEEGHYDRHVRRVRFGCGERQRFLATRLADRIGSLVHVDPATNGRYLIVWLPRGLAAEAVRQESARSGLDVVPLEVASIGGRLPPALALGFWGLLPREIADGVEQLSRVIERLVVSSTGRGV